VRTPAAIRETGDAAAWQDSDADRDHGDESSSALEDDSDFQVSCCTEIVPVLWYAQLLSLCFQTIEACDGEAV